MRKRPIPTDPPADFGISPRVCQWARLRGYDQLERHLEYFMLKCEAQGYRYVNWDAAFMVAIRDDWAGLRKAVKSPQGDNMVALGKQRGIEPRPGESMEQFTRRVMAARH